MNIEKLLNYGVAGALTNQLLICMQTSVNATCEKSYTDMLRDKILVSKRLDIELIEIMGEEWIKS